MNARLQKYSNLHVSNSQAFTVKPAIVVTSIKQSPFSCPVIEHFIRIEPLLRDQLSYNATFSSSQWWPLNTWYQNERFWYCIDWFCHLSNWWYCIIYEHFLKFEPEVLFYRGQYSIQRKQVVLFLDNRSSQTCIKRSPLGRRKSGIIRQLIS
jgi:hypothetical protein